MSNFCNFWREMDEKNEAKRYFPQTAEINILKGSIAKYFSFAERSPERSSFSAEISEQLQKYSTHWTKRAVRLWFNNNKSILEEQLPNSEKKSTFSPQIPKNQVNIMPPTPPQFIPNFMQTQILPQKQQNSPIRAPPQNRPPSVHFAPTFTITQPNPSMPQMQRQMPSIPNPQNREINAPWINDPRKLASESSNYQTLLCNLIEKSKYPNENMEQIVESYEKIIAEMNSKNIRQPVELSRKTYNFPSEKKILPTFSIGPPRPPSVDPHGALWQPRTFDSRNIDAYDCAYNSKTGAMYIQSETDGPRRRVIYQRNGTWTSSSLGTSNKIESCCGDENYCFALTSSSLIIGNLRDGTATPEIRLSPTDCGFSSVALSANSTVIAGFSGGSTLYYIDNNKKVKKIRPSDVKDERFVCAIDCINSDVSNGIVVAYSQTPVLSLYKYDGSLIRKFIGHTDCTNFIRTCGNTILTASDDHTAKLWDNRISAPALSFTADKKAIHGCSLSPQHVILCLYDKNVCAFDIRSPRPCLGVSTDDYAAESPYYDEEKDSLSFFGVASKEGTNDSLLFLNENLENSKYVFRQYSPFIAKLF